MSNSPQIEVSELNEVSELKVSELKVSELKGLIYGAMYGKGEYPSWYSRTRKNLTNTEVLSKLDELKKIIQEASPKDVKTAFTTKVNSQKPTGKSEHSHKTYYEFMTTADINEKSQKDIRIKRQKIKELIDSKLLSLSLNRGDNVKIKTYDESGWKNATVKERFFNCKYNHDGKQRYASRIISTNSETEIIGATHEYDSKKLKKKVTATITYVGLEIEIDGSFDTIDYPLESVASVDLYTPYILREVTPTGGGKKKTVPKKKPTPKKKTVPKKKIIPKKKTVPKKKVRKIHKGPRGGKYYISKGRKVYI